MRVQKSSKFVDKGNGKDKRRSRSLERHLVYHSGKRTLHCVGFPCHKGHERSSAQPMGSNRASAGGLCTQHAQLCRTTSVLVVFICFHLSSLIPTSHCQTQREGAIHSNPLKLHLCPRWNTDGSNALL